MIKSPSHPANARSQQKNMTGVQTVNQDLELLSLPEVAKMLQVSRITLYRLVARKALPFYRVGRRMRFHKDQVTEFLNRNEYGRTQN